MSVEANVVYRKSADIERIFREIKESVNGDSDTERKIRTLSDFGERLAQLLCDKRGQQWDMTG